MNKMIVKKYIKSAFILALAAFVIGCSTDKSSQKRRAFFTLKIESERNEEETIHLVFDNITSDTISLYYSCSVLYCKSVVFFEDIILEVKQGHKTLKSSNIKCSIGAISDEPFPELIILKPNEKIEESVGLYDDIRTTFGLSKDSYYIRAILVPTPEIHTYMKEYQIPEVNIPKNVKHIADTLTTDYVFVKSKGLLF